MKPIPYGRQEITDNDIDAVVEVLRSDYLTQGPKVEEFERDFAAFVGAKYAVAVANGTAALHLSVMALGLNDSKKVITTPITFAASANAVLYAGGEVDFVDVDCDSILIDIDQIKSLVEAAPKNTYAGIIPVGFSGNPINLEALHKFAKENNLWILEDACHALGAYYVDSSGAKQYCGNGRFSDVSIFSFHPVKHIACGEGGMVTTNNKQLYGKIKKLRTHGISKDVQLPDNTGAWYHEMQDLGYNYRLSDIHAALGISQLKRIETNISRRIEIAKKYDTAFEGLKLRTIKMKEGVRNAYHLYVIQTPNRLELYKHLKEHNIHCQIHYLPVYKHPFYQKIKKYKACINAEKYYESCISLPMYHSMSDSEQDYVIEVVNNFISK